MTIIVCGGRGRSAGGGPVTGHAPCTWCTRQIEPGQATIWRTDAAGTVHQFHASCWDERRAWLLEIRDQHRPWGPEVGDG
jgi:hypothetical protein